MIETFQSGGFQHPEDGWYHIEPLGEHPNRAPGVVQVIDREAAESIVKTFNREAQAGQLRHGDMMLVDHEHFSDDPNQESRAYAWLQELQNREDGIYGKLRWTRTGKAAVDGGDYRFFSTEYLENDCRVLNRGGATVRIRPMRLNGLTLTNMNNNRGQNPITNRGPGEHPRMEKRFTHAASHYESLRTTAEEEARALKISFDESWRRLRNRDIRRFEQAASRPVVPSGELASKMAANIMVAVAESSGRQSGFVAGWNRVRNRFPGLLRIINRESGWEALSDVEPMAREQFLKCWNDPEEARSLFSKNFLGAMDEIAVSHPDFSAERRWEQMKQDYPELFWGQVLFVAQKLDQDRLNKVKAATSLT